MDNSKDVAVNFLKLVIEGRIDEAFQKYTDSSCKHHNVFTGAGADALRKGMQQSEDEMPNKAFEIKQVIGEGGNVAIFSHLVMKQGEPGMTVVHRFRVEDSKIVELWDIAQPIPSDCPNSDGPF